MNRKDNLTKLLERAQELIISFTFEQLTNLLIEIDEPKLLSMIMDRMIELDEKSFIEFEKNYK